MMKAARISGQTFELLTATQAMEEIAVTDFYERNHISRPVPQAKSRSDVLGMRPHETILRNAFGELKHVRRWRGLNLWSMIGALTGHGSGYSAQICDELGWDPDLRITPTAELPRTAINGRDSQ